MLRFIRATGRKIQQKKAFLFPARTPISMQRAQSASVLKKKVSPQPGTVCFHPAGIFFPKSDANLPACEHKFCRHKRNKGTRKFPLNPGPLTRNFPGGRLATKKK